MIWECIQFYVDLFGGSANGVFYNVVWLASKIYENCGERGI